MIKSDFIYTYKNKFEQLMQCLMLKVFHYGVWMHATQIKKKINLRTFTILDHTENLEP